MNMAFVALAIATCSMALDGDQPTASASKTSAPKIRLQSPDPWATSGTAAGNQFNQRGATIGSTQNSPWTVESAQQSAANTANSVKNSVSSGIDQTIQEFNAKSQNLYNSAQQAGSDFGQQLKDMTGLNQSAASTTAPAATAQSPWNAPQLTAPQSTFSAPAATTATATATAATSPTWSSIKSEFAPPRLGVPTMTNEIRVASNAAAGGPTLPPPPSSASTNPPMQSVLVSPGGASANNTSLDDDWISGTGGGMQPVPPRSQFGASGQSVAAKPETDPWATPMAAQPVSPPPIDDRYRNPLAAAAGNGAASWANSGQGAATGQALPQPPAGFGQQGFGAQGMPQGQPLTQNPPMSMSAQALPQQQQALLQQQMPLVGGPTAGQLQVDEVPWKPLLAVSLALAGSLGANVFLGISYADARQRYRSLVAKTTHAFQKAAGAVA